MLADVDSQYNVIAAAVAEFPNDEHDIADRDRVLVLMTDGVDGPMVSQNGRETSNGQILQSSPGLNAGSPGRNMVSAVHPRSR